LKTTKETLFIDSKEDFYLTDVSMASMYIYLDLTKDSPIQRIKQFLRLLFTGKAKFRLT